MEDLLLIPLEICWHMAVRRLIFTPGMPGVANWLVISARCALICKQVALLQSGMCAMETKVDSAVIACMKTSPVHVPPQAP